MNLNALSRTRLFGIAGLAAVLLAGCGDSSTLDPSPTGTTKTELHGQQTLTIHVPDMGKRLELM
jgi:hypothetical protein